MYRASLSMSILTMASLAGFGIPAIASAEDLPPLHERGADDLHAGRRRHPPPLMEGGAVAGGGQRVRVVPRLRVVVVPVRARAPVRSFGPAPEDVDLGPAVFRGGGMLDADGPSQPRVGPSWQAIGSVTLPWRHFRLTVGYGPDGSFSLML